MPKGERWRQRERCRQKGSMLIGGAWVVVINDKGGDCWWNCHWCQHGHGVINATSQLMMYHCPCQSYSPPKMSMIILVSVQQDQCSFSISWSYLSLSNFKRIQSTVHCINVIVYCSLTKYLYPNSFLKNITTGIYSPSHAPVVQKGYCSSLSRSNCSIF